MRTFRPQATSNSLWAFAKLAYVPCQLFLTTSAFQARPLGPTCRVLGTVLTMHVHESCVHLRWPAGCRAALKLHKPFI